MVVVVIRATGAVAGGEVVVVVIRATVGVLTIGATVVVVVTAGAGLGGIVVGRIAAAGAARTSCVWSRPPGPANKATVTAPRSVTVPSRKTGLYKAAIGRVERVKTSAPHSAAT